MKYTKLITGLTALATTAMLFTGCSGSYTDFENPVPIVAVENANATTVPATEPVVATESEEITIPQTDYNEFDGYEMGDYVYVVYHSEGTGLDVRLGIVIAEVDEYVAVTHFIACDGEDLEAMFAEVMNSPDDVDDSISFYPIGDCYRTSEEAREVTGKEALESLETPSGNIFDEQ